MPQKKTVKRSNMKKPQAAAKKAKETFQSLPPALKKLFRTEWQRIEKGLTLEAPVQARTKKPATKRRRMAKSEQLTHTEHHMTEELPFTISPAVEEMEETETVEQ